MTGPGRFDVVVGVVSAPDGTRGVLLQLPDGWVIGTNPAEIRQTAAALLDAADTLEARGI